ncbi:MAG TPA: hypothetical protein VJC10_00830, partial [Patescibacteria group bacterium]|nr:hypothetical protein [Patescibacteria group bacterium]
VRYAVAYHIAYDKKAVEQTSRTLDKVKPRYIVILPDMPFFPFSLPNYEYKATIQDTSVYERIY